MAKSTSKKTNQSTNKKNNTQKKSSNTNKKKNGIIKKRILKKKRLSKAQICILSIVILLIGILLIFSSYAWFSTSLNVRVRQFDMIVSRNSGLSISLDGINYGNYVELSKEAIIDNLRNTYPDNTSQWPSNGLTPVSSPGIPNSNSSQIDIFSSGGVRYRNKKKENGFIYTFLDNETEARAFSSYIAFDLFLKNVTGSPTPDNLYIDYGTSVTMDTEASEEMAGLVNSVRIAFVKIGSVPHNTDVNTLQHVQCNNNCTSTIYEPNSTNHTPLSIERAEKYGVNLIDGQVFPTYSCIREGGPIYVSDTVSGSANLDYNYFALQNTINEDDFGSPIFEVPDGVTKMRVYVWIEGQDIDSLETDSEGADISISIDLIKDTRGYNTYN